MGVVVQNKCSFIDIDSAGCIVLNASLLCVLSPAPPQKGLVGEWMDSRGCRRVFALCSFGNWAQFDYDNLEKVNIGFRADPNAAHGK